MAEKKGISKKNKESLKQRILIFLAMLLSLCAIVLAGKVIEYRTDLAASKRELAALPALPQTFQASQTPQAVWTTLKAYNDKMRQINSDYAGVLKIDGTAITYPVMRGSDNVKYLTTSFDGSENLCGTLFMDYRCTGENLPHMIIYGHHVGQTDGSRYLFGKLDELLDEQNRTENMVIALVENNRLSEFEIFSARVTDVDDPAYQLDFCEPGSFEAFLEKNGAPPDAEQILTLSTCYGAGRDDKRIIVQGVLKNASFIDENQSMIAEFE